MGPEFLQPEALAEALEMLDHYGDRAKVLAGGTAITLMMQQELIAPEVLVSLAQIPQLNDIRPEEDGLHLGPMASIRDVEQSPLVLKVLPELSRTYGKVGNIRVRNQATIGGNLAEADYASDAPTLLLALDASLMAAGSEGSRSIPLSDFYLGFYTTSLQPGEVLADVFIPALPPNTRMVYLKFKSRSSEDRPCVGVAAVAEFDGDTCSQLRVAVGAASEIPVRLPEVEKLAVGEILTDDVIAEIADGYAARIDTLDDLRGSAWYRTQMIRVHIKQALMEVRDGSR